MKLIKNIGLILCFAGFSFFIGSIFDCGVRLPTRLPNGIYRRVTGTTLGDC